MFYYQLTCCFLSINTLFPSSDSLLANHSFTNINTGCQQGRLEVRNTSLTSPVNPVENPFKYVLPVYRPSQAPLSRVGSVIVTG